MYNNNKIKHIIVNFNNILNNIKLFIILSASTSLINIINNFFLKFSFAHVLKHFNFLL